MRFFVITTVVLVIIGVLGAVAQSNSYTWVRAPVSIMMNVTNFTGVNDTNIHVMTLTVGMSPQYESAFNVNGSANVTGRIATQGMNISGSYPHVYVSDDDGYMDMSCGGGVHCRGYDCFASC